ncbi:MAG: hypothetical protein KY445_16795 [Armatimonadetes bacterium]|nr:hypothetical protein [Armatimonadota bacterium]
MNKEKTDFQSEIEARIEDFEQARRFNYLMRDLDFEPLENEADEEWCEALRKWK